jgi:hypothetical protein
MFGKSRRTVVTGLLTVCLLVAIGILVLDQQKESPAHSAQASGPLYTPLTRADQSHMRQIALTDPAVLAAVGHRRLQVVGAEPWISASGRRQQGSVIRLSVSPAMRLRRRRLPLYIEPGPEAPPRTPSVHREVRVTATGISEINTYVLLRAGQVAEIEPAGDSLQIVEAKLLGPALGTHYRQPKGE